MKKVWHKIEKSKLLFAIFMIVAFAIFDVLTTGFSGAIKGFSGIVNYVNQLPSVTDSGKSIFGEIIWALCLIPVILIFKNKYIFNQKKAPFKERIKVMLPMLIVTTIMLVAEFLQAGGFSHFNIDEVVAMLLLYAFVGIYEEILCRGWLLNEFVERFGQTRKGIIYSVVLSSMIFGLMHFSNIFVGADFAGTLVQIIMATVVGVFYACIYLKTKNIWSVVFLHSFWDFAVSMTDMNVTSSCFEPSIMGSYSGSALLFVTIISAVFNLFYQMPGLLESFKILSKTSINELLPKKGQIELTEEQIKKDRRNKNTINVCQVILICAIGFILLNGISYTDDVCMNYGVKSINNYEYTLMNYSSYDITYDRVIECNSYQVADMCTTPAYSETFGVKLYISGNKLNIVNTYTNDMQSVSFDNNIYSFGVFKNMDDYHIMVVVRAGEGTLVYHGVVDSKKLTPENVITTIMSSLKLIKLPITLKVGYLTYNNELYPLFVTYYNDYYIIDDDGSIKLLTQ